MALHTVIMAGGSGTRFWPLSRKPRPKQLLAITSERTMLKETSARVEALTPAARQWVVCGEVHEKAVRAELPELPAHHIVIEPVGRNTAPCIGLACVHALREDPHAVLCLLPSDAYVKDAPGFCRSLQVAAMSADQGRITTLGIEPTRPETGYGYIHKGADLDTQDTLAIHAVQRFVEKPDRPTAEMYLKDGNYLWNAGIFVFRAQQMMHAIEKHLPELHAGLIKLRDALDGGDYTKALNEIYPTLPSVSIDYGVMEKETDLAVVPSSFGWSDVGSFAALPDVLPTDDKGNVVRGDVLLRDAQRCVVDARAGRLVAVVGASDFIVVDTPDAVLVLPKDRAQDVGKLLETLKAQGRGDLL